MTSSAVRTALVSGASRGIGLAIARAFVERGMRVAMLARGVDALHAAATSLGPLALPFACDVGDGRALDDVVRKARVELDGAPDVIVNSAGLFKLATFDTADPADFAQAVDVNLVGPFRLVRAFLPEMRARKSGHVVSVGSIADRVAFPENAAYAASKFGLRGLHEVLRAELVGSGVRATLVSPGAVDTALWDDVDPDNRPGFSPRSAMLLPVAVADAVLFAVTQPSNVNIDELRLSRS
jgi:NADP-dependent 3-hydroxy acid dehydrogenase YdfG